MTLEQLRNFIQARVVIGSRAYGLHTATSDFDLRGWYLAPTQAFLHLTESPPEQLEFAVSHTDNEVYWELRKYLKLLVDCNPTLLETLYTSLIQFSTPTPD